MCHTVWRCQKFSSMLFCRAVYSVRLAVFNSSCSVTLWLHATVASLPSFMALTAQNTSCHMFTWLWVSLTMTLLSLLYFKMMTFEDKLALATCSARGLGAPACQCLYSFPWLQYMNIYSTPIFMLAFLIIAAVHLPNCFSPFIWRQLQRNRAVR